MHRESIYVCTCRIGEREHVARVRAWDRREAAEVFARELELESGGDDRVRVAEVRVRPASDPDGDLQAGVA
jgi:hypothetical protein